MLSLKSIRPAAPDVEVGMSEDHPDSADLAPGNLRVSALDLVGRMSTHQLIDITNRGARLTLTTEELAQRWGTHRQFLDCQDPVPG